MDQKFQEAAECAKQLDMSADDEKLNIYGLYKQATIGDNNTAAPGFFSLDLKAKAKWNAWEAQKGKTQDQAKEEYIQKVVDLAKKYDLDSIVQKFQ